MFIYSERNSNNRTACNAGASVPYHQPDTNQTTSAQRYTPNTAEYIIPSKYHTANTVAQLRAQRGGARGGETGFATPSASPPREFPRFFKTELFYPKNPTILWKETPSSFPLEDPQTVLSDFYPQESPHHP